MNSYHKIAMSRADQSFKACQVAMGVGLLLIVGFGVAAVIQTDPVAAAAAGAISIVSDAVSAYISATYMKAYTQPRLKCGSSSFNQQISPDCWGPSV